MTTSGASLVEWQENGALTSAVHFGNELYQWTWHRMQDKVMEGASRC